MEIIKSYTDLEQSCKLAEILPLESADMCYIKHVSSDNPNWEFNEDFPPMVLGNVPINEITAETLPCWSLAALLGVLPQGYSLGNKKSNGKYYICMTCVKHDVIEYDEPIDACVEMVIRLNELNLL